VLEVDAEDVFEVAAVEDEQPVEALGADRSDEAFGDRVFTIRICSLRSTSSNGAAYLLSRSRIKKRLRSSSPVKLRLRACWVTQSPSGLVVQPASQTRRLACSMKNST